MDKDKDYRQKVCDSYMRLGNTFSMNWNYDDEEEEDDDE